MIKARWLASAGWLLAGPAFAQMAAPAGGAGAPPSAVAAPTLADRASPGAGATEDTLAADRGIGEIVVTASRRFENQQKVPIAISAFKGETLTTLGVLNTVDLPQLTPGLSFIRTLGGVNAYLRGIGTSSSGYTTEPPVATYVDGVYLPNSGAAAFGFNNIERVEILKGPQGTLYGRNTIGGVISVITREPGREPSLDVSAGYANYDTVNLSVYGSTPLTDTLSANLAGTYSHQGTGWGRNIYLGTDAFKSKDLGFQGKLKWAPGSDTTITLRGFYDRYETDQGVAFAIFPGSVATDGSGYLGEYRINAQVPPDVVQRQWNVSLKAEQGVGFATLTSTTAYIDNSTQLYAIQNGILGSPTPALTAIVGRQPATAKTFSQEFQLASKPSDSRVQWLLGAFYFHDDSAVHPAIHGTCMGGVCSPAPLPTQTNGFANTRSYSGFADVTYSLTPATRITGGLRYTSDKKTFSGFVEPYAGLPNTPLALPASVVQHPGDPIPTAVPGVFGPGIATDVTFNKLTYRAVLAQDFGPDIHAYASFNRGFKSGGFNPTNFTNPASRPEVLDSYEAGVKSELLDRALRLNLAVFHYDYQDVQVRSTAPPALPGSSLLVNAAKARVTGVDVDYVVAPLANLTIAGGAEYLDAAYVDFPAGICTQPAPIAGASLGGVVATPCNLADRRLPSAPRFSYTLGVTYVIRTTAGSFATAVNDAYKSDFFWEPDNRLKQNGYHLVNAALTWTAKDPRYSVELFGRNLNGAYYVAGAAVTVRNDLYVPAPPRTYGVTVRYHY